MKGLRSRSKRLNLRFRLRCFMTRRLLERLLINAELKQMRWVFLAPSLLLFTALVAIPGGRALIYSVQNWDGLSAPTWAGLDNFRALFADDLFLDALKHNVILMLGAGSLTLVLALTFAALVHRGIRGAGLFRVAFFFPNIIAAVAVAILWQLMYSITGFGVINVVLAWMEDTLAVGITWSADVAMKGFLYLQPESAHLDSLRTFVITLANSDSRQFDLFPFPFTASENLIYALIPMLTWISVGFYMILFLAAMQSIPEEFYEAADLEGANTGQQFWHITLPLIREVFIVGIVFFIISSAKFFDAVWVIESEFPNNDSHVMATVLYQKVFTEYNVGYAAAVAVVLFGLVFIATLVTLNFSRKESLEY